MLYIILQRKWDTESNCLHICFNAGNQGSDWNIDCFFKQGIFKKEEVIPEIFINDVSTDKNSVEEYKGYKFSIRKLSDCDEREDVLYIFEHEPMKKYSLEIKDIVDNKAHIVCKGVAVEDGYSSRIKTVKFEWDCWLPIETETQEKVLESAITPIKENAQKITIDGFGHAAEEDLEYFTQETGFIFPEDYREFLIQYNGGIPREKNNFINRRLCDYNLRVDSFYGLMEADFYNPESIHNNLFCKNNNTEANDFSKMIFFASVYGMYYFDSYFLHSTPCGIHDIDTSVFIVSGSHQCCMGIIVLASFCFISS